MGDSIEQRALQWFAGGDTGLSSRAIARHMLSLRVTRNDFRDDIAHPHDPSDLGRCLRLLELIPEWRSRLPEMADKAPAWRALVLRWDDLRSLMESEVGIDWNKGKQAPKTYSLMRTVLAEARS